MAHQKSCDTAPDFTACSFLGDTYLEINEKNDVMKYYQRACAAGLPTMSFSLLKKGLSFGG